MLTELFAIMNGSSYLRKEDQRSLLSELPWTDDPVKIQTFAEVKKAEALVVRMKTVWPDRDTLKPIVVRLELKPPVPVKGSESRVRGAVTRLDRAAEEYAKALIPDQLRAARAALARAQEHIDELEARAKT